MVSRTVSYTHLDLQNVKGLRDVIVRAVLQAQNLIHIVALGRQHDNRHIGKLANLLADLKAVQLWKHHIQKYDIIPVSYTHLDVYKRQLCGRKMYGSGQKLYHRAVEDRRAGLRSGGGGCEDR